MGSRLADDRTPLAVSGGAHGGLMSTHKLTRQVTHWLSDLPEQHSGLLFGFFGYFFMIFIIVIIFLPNSRRSKILPKAAWESERECSRHPSKP